MATSDTTRRFTPAPRLLASIMGVSLIVIGVIGLVWHLLGLEEWILGEYLGLDIFHLAMGVLALAASPTRPTARVYGWFATIVFGLGTIFSALGVELQAEHVFDTPLPYWLAHNSLGFAEVNYIVYALMALWGLLLARTPAEVDPWGSGDSHETLRSMPDREVAIAEQRRELERSS